MVNYAVSYFFCKVKPLTVILQYFNYSYALFEMFKALTANIIKCRLSCVAKWCMPQVMSQSYGFCQILIKPQCLGNCSCNLRNFQCMCKSCSIMVTHRCKKNLCLMLHSSKRFTMYNSIPVSLINCPNVTLFFFPVSTLTFTT